MLEGGREIGNPSVPFVIGGLVFSHKQRLMDDQVPIPCAKILDQQLKLYVCVFIITLRPRENCRHFADDILKCILLNENVWISSQISLKFVPKIRISSIPSLVQIMAWRPLGDKPLSEPIMVSLLMHICVTHALKGYMEIHQPFAYVSLFYVILIPGGNELKPYLFCNLVILYDLIQQRTYNINGRNYK